MEAMVSATPLIWLRLTRAVPQPEAGTRSGSLEHSLPIPHE